MFTPKIAVTISYSYVTDCVCKICALYSWLFFSFMAFTTKYILHSNNKSCSVWFCWTSLHVNVIHLKKEAKVIYPAVFTYTTGARGLWQSKVFYLRCQRTVQWQGWSLGTPQKTMGPQRCSTSATSCRGNHTAVRAHLWGETNHTDLLLSWNLSHGCIKSNWWQRIYKNTALFFESIMLHLFKWYRFKQKL